MGSRVQMGMFLQPANKKRQRPTHAGKGGCGSQWRKCLLNVCNLIYWMGEKNTAQIIFNGNTLWSLVSYQTSTWKWNENKISVFITCSAFQFTKFKRFFFNFKSHFQYQCANCVTVWHQSDLYGLFISFNFLPSTLIFWSNSKIFDSKVCSINFYALFISLGGSIQRRTTLFTSRDGWDSSVGLL